MAVQRVTKFLIFGLVLLVNLSGFTNAHGRQMRPPSRSSVWRFPEFQSQNPVPNYTDNNELFCGGIHQESNPGTNCGFCGDPVNGPKDNEMGGLYDKGIITAHYTSGQIIEVEAEITASHWGFMEWRLCPNGESQDCFNQNLLQRADGQGSQVPVGGTGTYRAQLKLPAGLTCRTRCVLQWNYRAGKNWGWCDDGSGGRLGCGPQETFRGCADVQIV